MESSSICASQHGEALLQEELRDALESSASPGWLKGTQITLAPLPKHRETFLWSSATSPFPILCPLECEVR